MDLILTFPPLKCSIWKGTKLGQNSFNYILAIKCLSNGIHSFNPGKAVANFFITKNRRHRVRKTVPVCVSASVLQSDRGGVRDAEVDHETERKNSEPEIVGENSVSDL